MNKPVVETIELVAENSFFSSCCTIFDNKGGGEIDIHLHDSREGLLEEDEQNITFLIISDTTYFE